MKYNIKAKDGSILAESVNMDSLTAFILNNPDKTGQYDVIPCKPEKDEDDDEDADEKMERLRLKFISTLSPSQYNDIHLGYKELYFTRKAGWCLKVKNKEKAGFYTPITVMRMKESSLRSDVLKSVKTMCEDTYDMCKLIHQNNHTDPPTFEEFKKVFDKIIIKE